MGHMKNTLISILLLTLCAGCVSSKDPKTWLVGSLTRMEDGNVMEFRIQTAMAIGGSATAGVMAVDPVTTNHFTGQYVGIMNSGSSSSISGMDAEFSNGNSAFYSSTTNHRWQSDNANTRATLNDGHGTVIRLRMTIHAGWVPHGMGEGIDNKGNHYEVMF